MKNILKYRTLLLTLFIACVAFFSSCSDWTDTESLEINKPTLEDKNPELYAKYLADLNAYKQRDHKVVYATFKNQKVATSRAHHMTIVPDSVDIISLQTPDGLSQTDITEMGEVRLKGTKVVYTISYATLEAQYKKDKEAFDKEQSEATPTEGEEGGEEEVPTFPDFLTYAATYMDANLAICGNYNYDGLTLSYPGREMLTMSDAEKAEYIANQQLVFSKVAEWKAANESKMLIFEGWTHFLADFSLLPLSKYIILPTIYAKSQDGLTQQTLLALKSGVPTNNILVSVQTFSTDPGDTKTGYFYNGNSAISEASVWVATDHSSFTKAGLVIQDIQNDYYNAKLIYKYTRDAISVMNPTFKN